MIGHNVVLVVDATDLHTLKWLIGCYMTFPQLQKLKSKKGSSWEFRDHEDSGTVNGSLSHRGHPLALSEQPLRGVLTLCLSL